MERISLIGPRFRNGFAAGLFVGSIFFTVPLLALVSHKQSQVEALADFANQIVEKSTAALEVSVADRDAAIKRAPQPKEPTT